LSEHRAGLPARPPLALLACASALSPLGMAVVLPTLGSVGAHFGVGYGLAQFVISAYLLGLGITQPFSGILCDRLGRRPVLLGGTLIFALASVGCALATEFPALVALRFLQAVGISVGTVASRAMIRDTHDPLDSLRALAGLAAAMGLAPVLAPALGGFLGNRFGHVGVFLATAVLAGGVLAWTYGRLAETGTRVPGPATPWWSGYGALLGSRAFVGNTLLYGFIQGTFFAFLGVGASVFEIELGLDQEAFGLIWGSLGILYVASAATAGRVVARLGLHGTLRVGAFMTLGAGLGVVLLTRLFGVNLFTLLVPLAGLMLASGIVTPMAMAGAVSGPAGSAGKAAGLSSAVALVLSGSFSILSGLLFAGSFEPIALLMATGAILTAAMLPLARGTGSRP
jgi:MFS transporter, DHA1 family, multidrug resistance protein